jgi:hypothetical protein
VGSEIAQGLDREPVVVGREGAVTTLGDDVGAGRTAAAAVPGGMRRAGVVLLDRAVVGQAVEVAADRRRGQPEPAADLGRGDRSVLGDDSKDPLPGALLVGADKHHTIVT